MDHKLLIDQMRSSSGISRAEIIFERYDEVYISLDREDFGNACLELHKRLNSPVMAYFAADERADRGAFSVYCAFLGVEYNKWFIVTMDIPENDLKFDSISRDIYSSCLFEREIMEMYGIEALGNPDLRRLNLHDEVWPEGYYPLRKDFKIPAAVSGTGKDYVFKKVEGEGIFEVPVGPVHAGIIGPGHFRFSAAGEPIINLETRFGFTHKGVEKIFEGTRCEDAISLSECISGDSSFCYSLSFCRAIEKIRGINVPDRARYLRGLFLELERMYNHVADIGGIALDVGFTFASAHASIIKEAILALNEKLCLSRYLRGINAVGGVAKDLNPDEEALLLRSLDSLSRDFNDLEAMLLASSSFMDRVDRTGILRKKTATDMGVIGLAARASGIALDLRKVFPDIYDDVKFTLVKCDTGDVLCRLNVRIVEFKESIRLIKEFLKKMKAGDTISKNNNNLGGYGLGYAEGWRGPVLFWLKIDASGSIARCKIVDPSFHNWQGLSYAVLGNIIPDFPVCNKSFNLSYSGNDL